MNYVNTSFRIVKESMRTLGVNAIAGACGKPDAFSWPVATLSEPVPAFE